MAPVKIENALTPDTCDFLAKFTKDNPKAFINDAQVIGQFKNKTLSYKILHRNMQEPFGSVERTLNYARFLGQTYIYKNFGELAFPDNTELTFWNPGDSMSVHSDNSWQEDAPDHVKDMEHPTKYRDYSVIFYLNDDYEGGEIYFPDHDIEISPKKGMAVVFPSNGDYNHGVKEIKNSQRFTIPVWYSKQLVYAE
tara:strand:- start:1512 stop:2096 length:585 start_codon:yes stop_codon:yes gene_type:complete